MNDSLYPLRVLREVVGRRSLTRAAEALQVSQPAVSFQIKSLEQSWGLSLLQRGPRGVRLRAEAEALYVQSLRVLAEAEELQRLTGDPSAHGPLEIAASNIPGVYWLPYQLSGWPGGSVHYRLGGSGEVLEWVRQAEVPLGVVGRSSPSPELEEAPLNCDRLSLMASPDHPWVRLKAGQEPDRQNFADQVLWLRERGSATRSGAERLLGERMGWFGRVLELPGEEALKQAVMAGLGLAVLSSWSTRRERRARMLCRVKFVGSCSRRFYLIRHRALDLQPRARQLWQLLLSAEEVSPARRGSPQARR